MDNYTHFKEVVRIALDDKVNTKRELEKQIRKLEWKQRLNEEQYFLYVHGELKPFAPLDIWDIRKEREFRYYFDVGTIVKLDFDNMTSQEKKEFNHLKDKHAVITRCYSDFHAFSRGSAYQHELRFSNGETSPSRPIIYDPQNFKPKGLVSTDLIIPIIEEEQKFYDDEFENRNPNQKFWWYVKEDE